MKEKIPRLVVFPEGTTTNGTCLIRFRRGSFVAGLPVQPVLIRHPFKHFSPTWETIPILSYAFRLLTQFVNFVEIIYLPVYIPNEEEKKDPSLFAENVRRKMAAVVNLPLKDATRNDKMRYHELVASNKFKWHRYYGNVKPTINHMF